MSADGRIFGCLVLLVAAVVGAVVSVAAVIGGLVGIAYLLVLATGDKDFMNILWLGIPGVWIGILVWWLAPYVQNWVNARRCKQKPPVTIPGGGESVPKRTSQRVD
jgi:hypothetical protein